MVFLEWANKIVCGDALEILKRVPPEFVDLPHYEFVTVVEKTPSRGTKVKQANSLLVSTGSKEELKLLTQFDAARNEIFFANKILLVEGPTERFSLPHIFKLKDIDINKDGISVIDSGGKENLGFIIKIIKAFEIPFVVLHDEDRNANNYSAYHSGPGGLNTKIENVVGDSSLVFRMDPDFEGIFGLNGGDKIRQAIEKVKHITPSDIPEVINDTIEKLIQL